MVSKNTTTGITSRKVFSNDATSKLLGFDYQKLIALEKCLEAKAHEHIWIECKGDVADANASIEVKHHKTTHFLTDNSEDVWKTIKNYIDNLSVAKNFSKLILFTTSSVREGSLFDGWNDLTPVEKKDHLIKHVPTKTIKDYHKKIKACAIKDLKIILERFSIFSDQPKIKEKWEELKGHPSLAMIPEEYRDEAVQVLYGLITKAAIKNSNFWQITIKDFQRDMRHALSKYTSDKIPFQFISSEDIEFDRTEIEFSFIQKMKDVSLHIKQQELAVTDYLRAQSSQIKTLSVSPTIEPKLEQYDENVERFLIDEKLNLSSDVKPSHIGTDAANAISRKLYTNTTSKPYADIVGVSDTPKYYRDGRIHHIVEETEFEWKFREDEL